MRTTALLVPFFAALLNPTACLASPAPINKSESDPTAVIMTGTLLPPDTFPTGAAVPDNSNTTRNDKNVFSKQQTQKNKADSKNDCGPSSFENHTTGASPLVADCQQLARNLAGGGTFQIESGSQWELARYGSCHFGIQSSCYRPDKCIAWGIIVKIGNQDIIDCINTAITKYTWEGRVGSQGHMTCQEAGSEADIPMLWGLY